MMIKVATSNTLPFNLKSAGIELISTFMDTQERHQISEIPWGITFPKPNVSFSLVHNEKGIYLKYWVSEQHIIAQYKNINDPVYKDSCVEFFIAFSEGGGYYNLEFNRLGVVLGGFGEGKTERSWLPTNQLEKIVSFSKINPKELNTGLYSWELVLFLPFEVFVHHNINGLTGHVYRANFYKCGDDLPQPHFLSWAPVYHPYPEFHLPQFFGDVHFI
jgi:hypothetical protein